MELLTGALWHNLEESISSALSAMCLMRYGMGIEERDPWQT